jgi:predicted nucleic acid-binding protein
MNFLVDTNIISELRKRERAHGGVARWAQSVEAIKLHTSVLVIGELRHGIELKRRTDPSQAQALERWLVIVESNLGQRIIPVDSRIADVWGRLGIPDPLPVVDGLLAATAKVHGLTLVTRNVIDMRKTGIQVINPFTMP